VAVTGGGGGANGRTTTGGGSTPVGIGGGGSGAQSGSTTGQMGGAGAAGKIAITYTLPASAYAWVATSGSADWTSAASWNPSRTTPATNDILAFNQGGSSAATNVPTQTIGKLQVSVNTTVALQPANGANTLTIGETASDSLTVAGGSQLDISGATGLTNLTVNVAAGAKGSINGSMTFSTNGATTTASSYALTAADAGGITFNPGATFTQNCGGNVFGSGTANSAVFASGSAFIQQAGSNPFQKAQPASVVVFQTGSLFSIQGNINTSFSGRTYADFELNSAGAIVSASGINPLTISNLSVIQGSLTVAMNSCSQKGGITVSSGATLDFNLTNTFNGSAEQTISGAGAFAFGPGAVSTIAGGSTLTLNLQANLALSGGILFTNNGTFNIKSALTGTGSINGGGSNVVASTGTLSPGTASTFGALTFATAPSLNGTNFMKIDRNGGSPLADEVILSGGTLNYGGTLVVTNIGAALQPGDTFTLFSANSFNNSFSSIQLPSLTGGYVWNTSQLNTSGTISVTSVAGGSPPKFSGFSLSGGDIMLNVTNGPPNGPVTVLASTNVTLPLAQWTVITTTNFDSSGNLNYTNNGGFSPTTLRRFYVLQTQ